MPSSRYARSLHACVPREGGTPGGSADLGKHPQEARVDPRQRSGPGQQLTTAGAVGAPVSVGTIKGDSHAGASFVSHGVQCQQRLQQPPVMTHGQMLERHVGALPGGDPVSLQQIRDRRTPVLDPGAPLQPGFPDRLGPPGRAARPPVAFKGEGEANASDRSRITFASANRSGGHSISSSVIGTPAMEYHTYAGVGSSVGSQIGCRPAPAVFTGSPSGIKARVPGLLAQQPASGFDEVTCLCWPP
jgi:hypothetical protein